jgi:hypothetical protein
VPKARVHRLPGRDHQLNNHLGEVAALAQLLSPRMNPVLFADELPVAVPSCKRGAERGQKKENRDPFRKGKPFHTVRLIQQIASINPCRPTSSGLFTQTTFEHEPMGSLLPAR